MTRLAPPLLLAILTLVLVHPAPIHAESPPVPPAAAETDAPDEVVELQRLGMSSVGIADSLSSVTETAISPLLVLGLRGAWVWTTTDADARATLPWFYTPWLWATCLALLGLIALKDVTPSTTVHTIGSQLEVIESHASALIATPIVLAMVVNSVTASVDVAAEYVARWTVPVAWAADGATTVDLVSTGVSTVLAGAITLGLFVVVWLSSHAVQVLMMLLPFPGVSIVLKTGRLAVLGLLSAAAAIDPIAGAVIAGILVLIAAFAAGWSLRLTVFGSVFVWDFFTFNRVDPEGRSARAFAARLPGVSPRTWGTLSRDDAGWVFTWRPFLIGPKRSRRLDDEVVTIGRALMSPVILTTADERTVRRFRLPPRYRGAEVALAHALSARGPEDVGLGRGIKALFAWFREESGYRRAAA